MMLLTLALGACETPMSVAVDFDPEADFASFRSYAWISSETLLPQAGGISHGLPISPIDDQRIRRAVDSRLAAKGWKQVPIDESDLVVSYGIAAEQKTEVYEIPYSRGHYRDGFGYGGWYAQSAVHARQYTEGTLTLEFFDRRTKQAAWVGWASQRLSKSEEREAVVERAVEKILTDFPSRS